MKQHIFLYIFFLFILSNVQSQNIDYFDNIIPPSPNVLALTKFGNIPVNHATGIPSVSVPIYNYQDNTSGLQLSISLDYHAGGIRVDEIASSIGIGWALNAGGVVSRTVRGIPDEIDTGYWNSDLTTSESGNLPSVIEDRPFIKMYHKKTDNQIDQFSYSINGRSGQFMWGKNDDLLIVKQEKINITKQVSKIDARKMITEIQIIDEKGFKYVFNEFEKTRSGPDFNSYYPSSWYTSKIFAPSGKDSIVFEYENTRSNFIVGYNKTRTLSVDHFSHYNESTDAGGFVYQEVEGKRISKIIFPNGVKTSFLYNTKKREDFEDYALSEIIVSDGVTKRSYSLKHNYTTNRLTLMGVDIHETTSKSSVDYRFEYKGALPNRLTAQQDHWGFFNLNDSDAWIHKVNHTIGGRELTIGRGDRRTDANNVLAGSLKRIYYPTGGYTEFEMEVNQAVDPRLSKTWTEIFYKRFKHVPVLFNGTQSWLPTETEFIFDGDDLTQTDCSIEFPSSYYSQPPKALIEIYNSKGGLILRKEYEFKKSPSTPNIFKFSTVALKKGKYKIKAYLNYCEGCYINTSLSWMEDISSNPIKIIHTDRELYVGGLRAKKISDYDGINPEPTQIHEYEYIVNGESSGTLGEYPKYSYEIKYDFKDGSIGSPNLVETYYPRHQYIIASSSTIYSLSQLGGSPVVYKKVKESITKNGNIEGYTNYFFKGVSYPTNENKFPFVPASNRSWIYGLSDSIKTYNKNGIIVKAEYNNYESYLNEYAQSKINNFRNLSIAPVKFHFKDDVIDWGKPLYFLSQDFYPEEGREELKSKVVINYENGKAIKSSTSYTYSPNNRQVSSEKRIDSREKIITKDYIYPQDIINSKRDSNNVYLGMMSKGQNAVLVETKESIDGVQIRNARTNYYYDKKLCAYLPESYELFFNGKAKPSILKCSSYSANARIQAYTKDDDLQRIILWSYMGQYPIAEIFGASYAQVEAAVKAEFGVTNIDDLSKLIAPNVANLQKLYLNNNLSGAHVTTYTYQPLVGITTMTDPTGITVTYEYDSFGRLKRTKDLNGKTIQEYDYHYRNH